MMRPRLKSASVAGPWAGDLLLSQPRPRACLGHRSGWMLPIPSQQFSPPLDGLAPPAQQISLVPSPACQGRGLGSCSVPYQPGAAALPRLGAAMGRTDRQPGRAEPNFNQARQNPSTCLLHGGNLEGEARKMFLPASWEESDAMEMQRQWGVEVGRVAGRRAAPEMILSCGLKT